MILIEARRLATGICITYVAGTTSWCENLREEMAFVGILKLQYCKNCPVSMKD